MTADPELLRLAAAEAAHALQHHPAPRWRCAECGLPATPGTNPRDECPRCGERALVSNDTQAARYTTWRRAQEGGVL